MAALLEARGREFSWDTCLGTNPLTRNWISIVILLAHNLLGADLTGVPSEVKNTKIPDWVAHQVKLSWGQPMVFYIKRAKFRTLFFHPRQWIGTIAREVKFLWPNPISATMRMGAKFDDKPRWSNQFKLVVSRTMSIISGRG